MSADTFWDNVLEGNERVLWTGRPKPRFHWRNWRLYGAAPMAAIGLLLAAAFILLTYGTDSDIWLLVIPTVLVLIPLRATLQQLRTYAATRYALTDKRVLFFIVGGDKTRVKAHPYNAIVPPVCRNTSPPCVSFLMYTSEKKDRLGFDYVERSDALVTELNRIAPEIKNAVC